MMIMIIWVFNWILCFVSWIKKLKLFEAMRREKKEKEKKQSVYLRWSEGWHINQALSYSLSSYRQSVFYLPYPQALPSIPVALGW